jgi:hypothetical protein
MTPSDDDLIARLRTSFQAAASRTPISDTPFPISDTPFDAILGAPAAKRSTTLAVSMSAAAAVAAIAGVAAVAANAYGGGSGPLVSVGGSAPVSSPGVTATPSAATPSAATPSAAGTTSGSAEVSAAPGTAGSVSADGCVAENYAVIASNTQLAGLTYLLPSMPAGYHLYGAWGMVDARCSDTATWYVEYDDAAGDGNTDNNAIQLTVHRNYPGELNPSPVADQLLTPVSVNGQPAGLMNLNGKGVGLLQWSRDGIEFELVAPMVGGSDESVLALADSIIAVAPDDARIKPPANCVVPAGQTCP